MLHVARCLTHAGSRCIFWSAGLVFRRLLPAQLFLDDCYSPHDGCESRSEISPRGWPAAKYCSHRPAATEFWTSKVSRTLPVFWFRCQKNCTCSVMTLILSSCCLWGSRSSTPPPLSSQIAFPSKLRWLRRTLFPAWKTFLWLDDELPSARSLSSTYILGFLGCLAPSLQE